MLVEIDLLCESSAVGTKSIGYYSEDSFAFRMQTDDALLPTSCPYGTAQESKLIKSFRYSAFWPNKYLNHVARA